MTAQPRGVDAAPASIGRPATAPAAPPRPSRRLGWGSLTAIIAGGVLLLALTFGGGMATAWSLGLTGGPAAGSTDTNTPGGTRPGFGDGGASRDQTLPGRRDQESESGETEELAPNS